MTDKGKKIISTGLSKNPPGLEHLGQTNLLCVHQEVGLLEVFLGYEASDKYAIQNSAGKNVYFAVKDKDCCNRFCYGTIRPFDMKIINNTQNEVINLHLPRACWLQSMEVTTPPGNVLGSIKEEYSFCKPRLVIKNAAGDVVLRIKGPKCTISCNSKYDFNIYSEDGENNVGKIAKKWSGLAREVFPSDDNIFISFPMDLDVGIKALLLGACFLIDFIYFRHGYYGFGYYGGGGS